MMSASERYIIAIHLHCVLNAIIIQTRNIKILRVFYGGRNSLPIISIKNYEHFGTNIDVFS